MYRSAGDAEFVRCVRANADGAPREVAGINDGGGRG